MDNKPEKETEKNPLVDKELITTLEYDPNRMYLWESIGSAELTLFGETREVSLGKPVGGYHLLVLVDGYGFFTIDGKTLFQQALGIIESGINSGEIKSRKEPKGERG